MNKKDCVLSIIITAHREGLVAHKTMKSVERAVKKIEEASIPYEVIVSIDRGDDRSAYTHISMGSWRSFKF